MREAVENGFSGYPCYANPLESRCYEEHNFQAAASIINTGLEAGDHG